MATQGEQMHDMASGGQLKLLSRQVVAKDACRANRNPEGQLTKPKL